MKWLIVVVVALFVAAPLFALGFLVAGPLGAVAALAIPVAVVLLVRGVGALVRVVWSSDTGCKQ